MRKIIVTGFIRTLTPLHIAAPSDARFDPATGKKAVMGGVPLTSVQTIGLPTTATRRSSESDDIEVTREHYDTVRNVPAISSNGIAGRLRRMIGNIFLEALRDKGEHVTITTYSAIKCGAATGNPDGAPISYDEYKAANDHPYLGLLGGGPRMIDRKDQIYNLLALNNETKDLLSMYRVNFPDLYDGFDAILTTHNADIPAYRQTGVMGYRRNDDLKDLKDLALAESTIDGFMTAFNERQDQIIKDFREKGEEGSGKTSLMTYQGLEFVLPFVSFPFVAVLRGVNDAQAGLWLRGFDRFCADSTLGGRSRNGFGEFAFLDGKITVVEDGEIVSSEVYTPTSYDTIADDSFRAQSTSAWFAAAKNVTGAEINQLMRLAEVKEKKGKKKGEATE